MGLMAFVVLVVFTFGKRSFHALERWLRVYEAFPAWGSVVVLLAFATGFFFGTKRFTELFGHLWYTAEPRRPGLTLTLWAVLFGVLLAVYCIFGEDLLMTFTPYVFALALVLFGPLYGIIGFYQVVDARASGVMQRASRQINLWFCIFAAYLGWLIGGLAALQHYPHYPSESPGELTAFLYTIPGFLCGASGVLLSRFMSRKLKVYKIIILCLITLMLFCVDCVLFFLATFPVPN